MSYLYLLRAACPHCETIVPHVEERDSPVGLMQDIRISAEWCPRCGLAIAPTDLWDVVEDAFVERTEPPEPTSGSVSDPTCPLCGSAPGTVSYSLAPNQYACTADCKLNTWVEG